MNKPMTEDNEDRVLGLSCPHSKVTCLILYLYSMELGSPPLYHEINRVCRTMDKSYLLTLGPYIKTLGATAFLSEMNREVDDKI